MVNGSNFTYMLLPLSYNFTGNSKSLIHIDKDYKNILIYGRH